MRALLRHLLGAGSRVRRLQAPAGPEEVLLQAVTVLRYLRARVTRYEAEAGTLEARLRAGGRLRLSAGPDGQVTIETHGRDWHGVTRILARELAAGGPR